MLKENGKTHFKAKLKKIFQKYRDIIPFVY